MTKIDKLTRLINKITEEHTILFKQIENFTENITLGFAPTITTPEILKIKFITPNGASNGKLISLDTIKICFGEWTIIENFKTQMLPLPLCQKCPEYYNIITQQQGKCPNHPNMSVVLCICKKGGGISIPHIHPNQEEWVYVLKGSYTDTCSGYKYTIDTAPQHIKVNQVHCSVTHEHSVLIVKWIPSFESANSISSCREII